MFETLSHVGKYNFSQKIDIDLRPQRRGRHNNSLRRAVIAQNVLFIAHININIKILANLPEKDV